MDFNKVTQVLVIDRSAKGLPFFELMVSAQDPNFDCSSHYVFYTEDLCLLNQAKAAFGDKNLTIEFLTQNKDSVFKLQDAKTKFGTLVEWDLFDFKFFVDKENKSVVLFTALQNTKPFVTLPARFRGLTERDPQRKIVFNEFCHQNQLDFENMSEQERNTALKHNISLEAFKDLALYKRYFAEFNAYFKAKKPGLPLLVSACEKLKKYFCFQYEEDKDNCVVVLLDIHSRPLLEISQISTDRVKIKTKEQTITVDMHQLPTALATEVFTRNLELLS